MASKQMQEFLETTRNAAPKKQSAPTKKTRMELDDYMAKQPVAKGFTFNDTSMANCPVRRFIPDNSTNTSAILYLHGGGYFTGSSKSHHALMSNLCVSSNAMVIGLDYRLAPEYPYPAALSDAIAVYQEMNEDRQSSQIMIAGDSAGGGLTMACLHQLRDTAHPMPGCAALLSPNVDLSSTGAYGDTKGLEYQSYYAGRYPKDHPGVSPVFADMKGLPPILIQFANEEAFVEEIERLIIKLKAADVAVEVQVFEDAFHVFQMFTEIPESIDAIQQIAEFFQSQTMGLS